MMIGVAVLWLPLVLAAIIRLAVDQTHAPNHAPRRRRCASSKSASRGGEIDDEEFSTKRLAIQGI